MTSFAHHNAAQSFDGSCQDLQEGGTCPWLMQLRFLRGYELGCPPSRLFRVFRAHPPFNSCLWRLLTFAWVAFCSFLCNSYKCQASVWIGYTTNNLKSDSNNAKTVLYTITQPPPAPEWDPAASWVQFVQSPSQLICSCIRDRKVAEGFELWEPQDIPTN